MSKLELKSVVMPSATKTKSQIQNDDKEYRIDYLIDVFTRNFNEYQVLVGMDEGETSSVFLKGVYYFTTDLEKERIVEAGKRFDDILRESGWQGPLTHIWTEPHKLTLLERIVGRPDQEKSGEVRVRVTKPLTKAAKS